MNDPQPRHPLSVTLVAPVLNRTTPVTSAFETERYGAAGSGTNTAAVTLSAGQRRRRLTDSLVHIRFIRSTLKAA